MWLASLTAGAVWLALSGYAWSEMLWMPLAWVPFAAWAHEWTWTLLGVVAPVIRLELGRPKRAEITKQRKALIELWAMVGLYLSAGLGFWSALEEGVEQVQVVADPFRELSRGVARDREPVQAMAKFCQQIPGPESELIATMVDHGYRHGIVVDDVISQAHDLEDRFAFEQELKRRQDPLWLTVVPALMLLNVLVLLGVPMAVSIFRNWHGL